MTSKQLTPARVNESRSADFEARYAATRTGPHSRPLISHYSRRCGQCSLLLARPCPPTRQHHRWLTSVTLALRIASWPSRLPSWSYLAKATSLPDRCDVGTYRYHVRSPNRARRSSL